MSARERAEAAKADADRLAAEEARKQALFYARLPPLTQESGDDCNIWYWLSSVHHGLPHSCVLVALYSWSEGLGQAPCIVLGW
jgi:hypothetical protein